MTKKSIKINWKKFLFNIILPTALTIILFVLLIFTFILPYFEKNMLEGKKVMIKELVSSALDIASEQYNYSVQGLISEKEAKEKAIKGIENLRYGNENKDYFWITDMYPYMIMHPYVKDLIGKDLSYYQDPHGKKLFVEMVKVVKSSKKGYVHYMWQWKNETNHIVPKISYVEEFKPWGWIIGTGIYIEDVKAEIKSVEKKLVYVSVAISILMALLLSLITGNNYKAEKRRKVAEEELRHSQEKYRTLVEASTEGTWMIIEGKTMYFNQKLLDILETNEDIINKITINDLLSQGSQSQIVINDFLINSEIFWQGESLINASNGRKKEVIISISKIKLATQNGLIVIMKNIASDDSKNVLNKEQLEYFRELAGKIGIGLFTASPGRKGKFTEINSVAVKMLGYETKEELSNSNILDLIKDSDQRKKFIRIMSLNDFVKDMELKVSNDTNSEIWILVSAISNKNENGEVENITGLIYDINYRKQAELMKIDFLKDINSYNYLLSHPVCNLETPVIACTTKSEIGQIVNLMSFHQTDGVIVQSAEKENIGIITSENIKNTFISTNKKSPITAGEIMTAPLHFVINNEPLSSVINHMTSLNIEIVAVKDESDNFTGIVSLKNVLKYLFKGYELLLERINKSKSLYEIENLHKQLPLHVYSLVNSGVKTPEITSLITSLSDTIVNKLAKMIITEIGEPPVPFAFVCMGSEGRKEQTILTDQDNAIIYSDVEESEKERVSEYFLSFAEKINSLLHQTGYLLCKGDIMARNPKWNQSLSTWKQYFSGWIMNANPQDLLEVSIFFDFRCVYGDSSIADQLREHINQKLKHNTVFFIQMAQNCLIYKPPVSMFGKLQSQSSDSHGENINIKQAARLIVSTARLFALKQLINETNTLNRLSLITSSVELPQPLIRDLSEAFNYLMHLQFRHQSQAFVNLEAMDNILELKELSGLELNMVKYIFTQIVQMQANIKISFNLGG